MIFQASAAAAATYYVAPNGSPSNDGSISRPLDLFTVLQNGGPVRPGDTVLLRGGVYRRQATPNNGGDLVLFESKLNGTASAPIIVRQYPGERAILDGNLSPNIGVLTVLGSYTYYWGFEITNSDPNRYASRGNGLDSYGHHNKFINLVIHDTGQGVGFWSSSAANESELYGSIISNVGLEGSDRGHGHSVYVQNVNGTKRIVDNIMFNGFSFGIHAYTENSRIDNLWIEGNMLFNHGILSASAGAKANLLFSGAQVAQNPNILGNFGYYPSGSAGRSIDISECNNGTFRNNYLAGGTPMKIGACTNTLIADNTIYGPVAGSLRSSFPNNQYGTSPTGVFVGVRPNAYEPGRANIVVYNWARQSQVTVDLSGAGLSAGDAYEVRDAQNYLAGPIATGTFNGQVTLPMTGLTAAPVFGNAPVQPGHTDAEFGVFVIQKVSSGAPQAPTASFTVSPATVAAGQAATLTWSTSGATSVVIDQGIGGVSASGTRAVTPQSTTTYRLTASNANGSTTQTVTVSVTGASSCVATVAGDRWRGEYFNNTALAGTPAMVRDDGAAALAFDWGTGGSPGAGCGIGADNFSARWTRTLVATAGTYRFTVTGDDGVRLKLDGQVKIDQWRGQSPTTFTADVVVAAGSHTVELEYFELTGGAVANLSWVLLASAPIEPPPSGGCSATVSSDRWKGEYFNNTTLAGSPALVRDDGASTLAFDWGAGAPNAGCGLGVDNFSARWTRTVSFGAGTYRFTVTGDDGVRLKVDGQTKINEWKGQSPTTFSAEVALTAGAHTLELEYFEQVGGALANLSWVQVGTSTPPPPPPQTACVATVGADRWRGEFFSNTSLAGIALMVRDEGAANLAFDWGSGSPAANCGLGVDGFSARWTRTVTLGAGNYRFTVTGDDGVRLKVDGVVKIDQWRGQSPTTFTADVTLSAGAHTLELEYFEQTGGAVANLSFQQIGGTVTPPATACVSPVSSGRWRGEYFSNATLSGTPVMVRDDGDASLAFDWAMGSPSATCGLGVDNFSARWTRTVTLGAGTYRFTITGDDGVRLKIDGVVQIDQWRDQSATAYTAYVPLTGGTHLIELEYYEKGVTAVAQLTWALN